MHKEKRLPMDDRGRNDIQTNEKINSRVAHANCTKRKRGTNHLFGGSKGSHQCNPMTERNEVTGRLLKWSFKLGEYGIHYRPRTSVKGQILVNFIVERPKNNPPDTPMEDKEELLDQWVLFTDGSSCIDGSEDSLILTNPEGAEFTYALRFRFDATNNEAEYEAFLNSRSSGKQSRWVDKI
ncbi:hypothetical protein Tco_0969750 [Tanacetum coccineum]